ncbi:hypothetical protein D1872_333080 [compost metagenome]
MHKEKQRDVQTIFLRIMGFTDAVEQRRRALFGCADHLRAGTDEFGRVRHAGSFFESHLAIV